MFVLSVATAPKSLRPIIVWAMPPVLSPHPLQTCAFSLVDRQCRRRGSRVGKHSIPGAVSTSLAVPVEVILGVQSHHYRSRHLLHPPPLLCTVDGLKTRKVVFDRVATAGVSPQISFRTLRRTKYTCSYSLTLRCLSWVATLKSRAFGPIQSIIPWPRDLCSP